jgi:hypothetical protein
MMDYTQEAERHRRMANEFRTMAEGTQHEVLRVRYLILAEGYDQLAANEDRVAANLRIAGVRTARPPSAK